MKKKIFYAGLAFLTVGLFVLTSCDNTGDDLNISEQEIEMGEDDALADELFNSLDAMVDADLASLDAAGYSTVGLKSAEDDPFVCKTVTVTSEDLTTFPKTITIDYGEGCTVVINGDSITRSGIIQIVLTDRWFVEGAVKTITFIDFYINDVQIEGTRIITNLGLNDDGNLVFEIVMEDGTITYDTLEYTRTCHQFREWIRDVNPLNDSILITGECSGMNFDGYKYQHTIQNRLVLIRCYEYMYQWTIVGGEVDIVRNGNNVNLNFGNGGCDDSATLTVNGQSKEIHIRNRMHYQRKNFGGKK